MYVCMCVCMYVCVRACLCVCVYMYMSVCERVYIQTFCCKRILPTDTTQRNHKLAYFPLYFLNIVLHIETCLEFKLYVLIRHKPI
jgi:hypothetical protein